MTLEILFFAIAFVIVGCISKIIGCGGISKSLGFSWKESYQINKYKNISSLYETVVDGYYHFWEDVGKGDALSYKAHSYSKCTALNFVVPEGGYFVISNNFASPGVYFYNCLDGIYLYLYLCLYLNDSWNKYLYFEN